MDTDLSQDTKPKENQIACYFRANPENMTEKWHLIGDELHAIHDIFPEAFLTEDKKSELTRQYGAFDTAEIPATTFSRQVGFKRYSRTQSELHETLAKQEHSQEAVEQFFIKRKEPHTAMLIGMYDEEEFLKETKNLRDAYIAMTYPVMTETQAYISARLILVEEGIMQKKNLFQEAAAFVKRIFVPSDKKPKNKGPN